MNYGAPIDNLKAAMKDAGLESVDLWIGSGGASVAQLVLPVLKPKAFLPVIGMACGARSTPACPDRTRMRRLRHC